MRLSLIIPCYNEEEGINYLSGVLSKLLPRLRKKYELELIFVDDGSKDNTHKLLKKYFGKWEYARILRHRKNMGFGAAFRTGIRDSKGDVIFQLDADCTYPTNDIISMIEDTKRYDIVTASPYHPKGKVKDVESYRLFLSKAISSIYNIISGARIYTFTSYFRAYRGNMLRSLKFKSNGFTCTAEVMLLCLMKKGKIKEYPSVLSKRIYGQSKMRTLRVIKDHMKLILRIIWLRLLNIFKS
jgi:dolichol-phosphate mannosyltransferase